MNENHFQMQLQNYQQQMEQALESERLRRQQIENQYTKDSIFPMSDSNNMMEFQLDSNRLLDKAYHILSGHIIVKDSEGNDVWADPNDDRLKIFSKYGVERIMQLLSFYITPEVVLSIFELEEIKREVRDFGIELTDMIGNLYEEFFYYPKPEELFKKFHKIIEENPFDFPSFIIQKDGKSSVNEVYLYNKCIEWSSNELKRKLANYPVIVNSLLALVHANYRRALKGETLKSFRTMTHISQTLGGTQDLNMNNKKEFSLMKPSTWKKS